jgi:hypothetical protein
MASVAQAARLHRPLLVCLFLALAAAARAGVLQVDQAP